MNKKPEVKIYDYTTYLTKIMNIKNLFSKFNLMTNIDEIDVDINSFIKEVSNIEKEVNELVKNEGTNNIDYEPYITKLESMIETINDKYQGSYLLDLFADSVRDIVDYIDEDNYQDYVIKLKRLIDYLNEHTLDNDDKKDCLDDVCNLIYKSLLRETIINKSEILSCLKVENYVVMQKLAALIREDISKLSADDRIEIELNNHGSIINGLVFKKIAANKLNAEVRAYKERKETALMEVLNERDSLLEEKNQIDGSLKQTKENRSDEKARLRIARLKISAGVLVPILLSAGSIYGGAHVDRYHKITEKRYNLETNKPISDDSVDYETSSIAYYNYRVNIKKYSPWIKSTVEDGYIREVLEYDYTEYDDSKSFDANRVLQEIKPSHTIETRLYLNEDDSMEEESIIVTLKEMDKSDRRIHIAPTFLIGGVGTLLAVILSVAARDLGLYDDFKKIRRIKENLKNTKITIKRIKEEYVKLGEKVVRLQDEYETKTIKYEDLEAEISPELLETARKYVKR